MATITNIKLKRSATAGKIPLTTDLDLGEIAINTYDGKLYIKKNDGSESVVLIGPTPAEANSSYIPNIDNTYDLGSATFEWRNLYVDGTANIDSLVADTAIIEPANPATDIALTVKSQLKYTSPDDGSNITTRMLDTGVLSFSGSAGQLFSISDSMTGTIFAVNDISGVPSIEVDDDGTIRLAETFGNVLIGTATDNGTDLLQVDGSVSATSFSGAGTGLTGTASSLSIGGNAATVTNGVVTTGSYADPSWITSLNYSKLTGTVPTWNQNTTGNAATATKLATARSIDLNGDVSGSVNFDGSANVTLTTTIADDSHNHIISNIDGLQIALDGKINDTGDTMTGTLTISGTGYGIKLYDTVSSGTPFIDFDTSANQGLRLYAEIGDTNLPETGQGFFVGPSPSNTQFPGTGNITFNVLGEMYAGGETLATLKKVFHDGYHPNADKLTTSRAITLSGDVTGTANFDGSAGITITATVADDSHAHVISNVDGLQTALDAKIAIASIVDNLTSTSSTAPLSANQGKLLKDAVDAINVLLASDETTLDTLQEIVDYIIANRGTLESLGIGNISGLQTALDAKLNLTGGTLTGDLTIPDKIIHSGDTNTSIRFPAADTFAVETAGTERLRVNSAGDVGIGTSSPSALLTVGAAYGGTPNVQSRMVIQSTSNTYFTIGASTTGDSGVLFADSGDNNVGAIGYNHSTNVMAFVANASERLRIDSTGNVGIGTTTPGYALDVKDVGESWVRADSSTSTDDVGFRFAHAGINHFVIGHQGDDDAFVFYDNIASSERMRIDSTGNIGIGTTSPAYKLDVYQSTGTGSTANGTTLARFHNYVGSDLSQQKTFIDFTFQDDNPNETPQVRIGAEVGTNVDANDQFKEGSGAFVVYTNNAESDSGDAGASLTEKFRVDYLGNVGIGTTSPSYKLEVNGSFAATTKSFVIDHPTKEGMKLRYGSLEGPENGVYVRGRLTDSNTIILPDYWIGLIDPDSITVNLTPIGGGQSLYVKHWDSETVTIANSLLNKIDCFYTVYAERIDVEKLQVEF